MEWSHADCSRNLLGYTNQCSRLRLDRHVDLKCDFSSERYNHANHLSKSVAIHMEWSHADCSRNLFGHVDQCSRLRLDRHTHPKCDFSSERYNHTNHLSKSIPLHPKSSHFACSTHFLSYTNQCSRLRLDRHVDLKCYFSSEGHNHANHLSKSIAL